MKVHRRAWRAGASRLFCAILWFGIGFGLAGMIPTQAEKYLTREQAAKICFPSAERFDSETIRFTAEERKAIEKKSGVKMTSLNRQLLSARHGTNLLGILVLDQVLGKHEWIDYAVAISPEGKVLQVEVLEFRESHGYEIRAEKWRAQFKGKSAKDRFRLHDDIYNISGATISCRNVTEGVKRLLTEFEHVLRARLVDPPGRGGVPDKATEPKP